MDSVPHIPTSEIYQPSRPWAHPSGKDSAWEICINAVSHASKARIPICRLSWTYLVGWVLIAGLWWDRSWCCHEMMKQTLAVLSKRLEVQGEVKRYIRPESSGPQALLSHHQTLKFNIYTSTLNQTTTFTNHQHVFNRRDLQANWYVFTCSTSLALHSTQSLWSSLSRFDSCTLPGFRAVLPHSLSI